MKDKLQFTQCSMRSAPRIFLPTVIEVWIYKLSKLCKYSTSTFHKYVWRSPGCEMLKKKLQRVECHKKCSAQQKPRHRHKLLLLCVFSLFPLAVKSFVELCNNSSSINMVQHLIERGILDKLISENFGNV